MRKPEYAGQFKRDIKLAQKRGKNMAKLKQLLELIINSEVLPASYLDNPLKGDWRGCLVRSVTARISNQIGC